MARDLVQQPWSPPPPAGGWAARTVAIGDPQTTDARFFAVLDAHGLLGDDGRLAAGVALVSIGDHFDFKPLAGMTVEETGRHGHRILRWLADHPPDRAVIVLGNHDLSRVMELHDLDDATFQAARALAIAADAAERGGDARLREQLVTELAVRAPGAPTTEALVRDWSGFAAVQRELVQALLLARRGRLAVEGRLRDGRPLLLTHAGVSAREVELLGEPPVPGPVCRALERHLEARVARVRSAWSEGKAAPLDLGPLHITGRAGEEGGGLLYHRPANPAVESHRWGKHGRRRFDARTLPPGLVQACGHSGPDKALADLRGFDTAAAERLPRGALRALVAHPDGRVVYGGLDAPQPEPAGVLLMIDGGIHQQDLSPRDYALLELLSLP